MNDRMYLLAKKLWHATYIRVRDSINDWKYKRYWREHKLIRKGTAYGDKTFYIIRRRETYTGLFSDFMVYVYRTKLVLDAGYIPVIDMQTSENIYLRKDQVGKVNAWEYYFKQPGGYSLKDIEKARNVICGGGDTKECFPYLNVDYLLNKVGDFEVYQKIAKRYFHLSTEAQKNVADFFEHNLKGRKVLGVLCRGTDYVNNRPSGHPIQPSLESIFCKVTEILQKYQCNIIFLGTEDENIYLQFRKKYGDLVITNRKHFVQYSGEHSIGKLIRDNTYNLKEEGMEYLVTIALLSRCHCFVGGLVSGTIGAMLMRDQFEYVYIFDLGLYS